MLAIRTKGRKLRSDKRGATVIEYGLIVSLIVVAIMGALAALGGGANGMWGKLDNEVAAAM
ncbi:MAG: Flp family type IVb pilin [Sphingomicrobium sp.]|nr:Flp family type IVb pilin [Qipengyuania sp.]